MSYNAKLISHSVIKKRKKKINSLKKKRVTLVLNPPLSLTVYSILKMKEIHTLSRGTC